MMKIDVATERAGVPTIHVSGEKKRFIQLGFGHGIFTDLIQPACVLML